MMTLTDNGQKYAVIPMKDYEMMANLRADFEDNLAIAEAKLTIERGEDELLPLAMMEKLLSGQSRLKIWRNYRGLTASELSQRTGISVSVISKIEHNKQAIDVPKLKKLATALNLEFEDLL